MTTSSNNISYLENINIYPNPNQGNFNIEISEVLLNEELDFVFYHILGKKLRSFKSHGTQIISVKDLDFPEGITIMEIKSKREVSIRTLMKTKN